MSENMGWEVNGEWYPTLDHAYNSIRICGSIPNNITFEYKPKPIKQGCRFDKECEYYRLVGDGGYCDWNGRVYMAHWKRCPFRLSDQELFEQCSKITPTMKGKPSLAERIKERFEDFKYEMGDGDKAILREIVFYCMETWGGSTMISARTVYKELGIE